MTSNSKQLVAHDTCVHLARRAAHAIKERANELGCQIHLYGVPRGGIPVMYLLLPYFDNALHVCITDNIKEATFIIDDVIDSGATLERCSQQNPRACFVALFRKSDTMSMGMLQKENPPIYIEQNSNWIVFPWEQAEEHDTSAEDSVVRMLQYIGEDPQRGGLLETPKRVVKAWGEWFAGYKQDPHAVLKEFEDGGEKYDELVIVKSIPVHSFCEHHLAPFFGVVHCGYIPSGKIVGLSKLSRLVDIYAKRLQVQERLTRQIADALWENLNPKGVAVVVRCRHMCMESRGIQRQGTETVTSAMLGVMHDEASARAEFLSLVERG